MNMEEKSIVRSFEKGLDVLSKFAFTKEEWGIKELADELAMSKSTIFRLIKTLENKGFVEKDDDSNKYRIGLELFNLSSAVTSKFTLIDVSAPVMRKIVEVINESVYLYVYKQNHIIFVHKEESSNHLRYVLDLGIYYEMYLAAAGKAILAFMPEEKVTEILSKDIKKYTDKTITDPNIIKQQLNSVRLNRFSFTSGERFKDMVGFASPIFDKNLKVLAGINLTIPISRYDINKYHYYGALIRKGAEEISEKLGCDIRSLDTASLVK
jgi:IclR family transcriptional regulator, KDG regulon repressor